MHTHWIEILDRADDDCVVGQIAHHLELIFFPAEHAFFDQNLVYWRQIETALQDVVQLFAVVGNAAAGSTESEAWPEDHGIADPVCERLAVIQVVHELRLWSIE